MAERHSGFVNQVAGVGQVTVEDHRFAQSALWTPSGNITSRSGMVPNSAAASAPGTVKATSPTANGFVHVDPFRYVMQSVRGGGVYTLTLDAIKDINILGDQAADPSNPRNDLIVAHQRDAYFTDPNSDMVVRHVIGTPAASPADPDPSAGGWGNDYVTLARVVVPANATSIQTANITNFAISWTVATGGTVPVRNQTERDALVPWSGMRCYRIDKGWEETYIGGGWRLLGIPLVTTLGDVTNPYTQQIVRLVGDGLLYEWNGSAWVALDSSIPACKAWLTGTQSIATSTDVDVSFSAAPENWTDAGGTAMWSAANPTRITIRKPGLYEVGFNEIYAVSDNDGKRVANLTVNNTGVPTNAATLCYDENQFNNSANGVTKLGASTLARLAVGDILRLATWQNSGSAQNVIGNTIEGKTDMWAFWRKP